MTPQIQESNYPAKLNITFDLYGGILDANNRIINPSINFMRKSKKAGHIITVISALSEIHLKKKITKLGLEKYIDQYSTKFSQLKSISILIDEETLPILRIIIKLLKI